MKIKLLMSFPGLFHGHLNLEKGAVVDVDDANALRYIHFGYAEAAAGKEVPVETATIKAPVETAALTAVVEKVEIPEPPKALDDDDETDEPGSEGAEEQAAEENSAPLPGPTKRPGTAAPNARRR